MSDRKPDDDYPTREQIAEVVEAFRRNGNQGILEVLKKRRAEREANAAEQKQTQDRPQTN